VGERGRERERKLTDLARKTEMNHRAVHRAIFILRTNRYTRYKISRFSPPSIIASRLTRRRAIVHFDPLRSEGSYGKNLEHAFRVFRKRRVGASLANRIEFDVQCSMFAYVREQCLNRDSDSYPRSHSSNHPSKRI